MKKQSVLPLLFLLPIAVWGLASCIGQSMTWVGLYHGVLPCGDCSGLDTLLTLNEDQSYLLETRYIGKSDQWHQEQGTFVWQQEDQTLSLIQNNQLLRTYEVADNALYHLDNHGVRVQGVLEDHYVLSKEPAFNLKGITWQLVQLHEDKIHPKTQNIHFLVPAGTDQVTGKSVCNDFFGRLSDQGTGHIKISHLGMTRMACSQLTLEIQFTSAFSNATFAVRKGNQLFLSVEEGAKPVAVFEAM